jgi:hypothetical protein
MAALYHSAQADLMTSCEGKDPTAMQAFFILQCKHSLRHCTQRVTCFGLDAAQADEWSAMQLMMGCAAAAAAYVILGFP